MLRFLFIRSKSIVAYGFLLAVLVFALKWMQWKFVILDNSTEIYAGCIAVFFTVLGIWIASHVIKPKKEIVEKEIASSPIETEIDTAALEMLNLSKREYEVLQLLSKGHSNAEIAEKLFVSVSTVKTHVSNLFVKLDVRSRTQAMDIAKRLKIIN